MLPKASCTYLCPFSAASQTGCQYRHSSAELLPLYTSAACSCSNAAHNAVLNALRWWIWVPHLWLPLQQATLKSFLRSTSHSIFRVFLIKICDRRTNFIVHMNNLSHKEALWREQMEIQECCNYIIYKQSNHIITLNETIVAKWQRVVYRCQYLSIYWACLFQSWWRCWIPASLSLHQIPCYSDLRPHKLTFTGSVQHEDQHKIILQRFIHLLSWILLAKSNLEQAQHCCYLGLIIQFQIGVGVPMSSICTPWPYILELCQITLASSF